MTVVPLCWEESCKHPLRSAPTNALNESGDSLKNGSEPTPQAELSLDKSQRLRSIDVLRGLVMVLMVLDHTRDFVGKPLLDATDPNTASLGLFFTRWLTHLCAPTFVFLAGVSARCAAARKGTSGIIKFLATRGAWLIVLELTVVHQGWHFGFNSTLSLGVIWALGISMMLLALVCWLPDLILFFSGILIVVGHNLCDNILSSTLEPWGRFYSILRNGGLILTPWESEILVLYPAIPWLGVMLLGWTFGRVIHAAPLSQQKTARALGVVCLILFAILRFTHSYGDKFTWENGANATYSLMTFLQISKYPPSLHYLLATLGISC
jgi:uncharacterized membrane protein